MEADDGLTHSRRRVKAQARTQRPSHKLRDCETIPRFLCKPGTPPQQRCLTDGERQGREPRERVDEAVLEAAGRALAAAPCCTFGVPLPKEPPPS